MQPRSARPVVPSAAFAPVGSSVSGGFVASPGVAAQVEPAPEVTRGVYFHVQVRITRADLLAHVSSAGVAAHLRYESGAQVPNGDSILTVLCAMRGDELHVRARVADLSKNHHGLRFRVVVCVGDLELFTTAPFKVMSKTCIVRAHLDGGDGPLGAPARALSRKRSHASRRDDESAASDASESEAEDGGDDAGVGADDDVVRPRVRRHESASALEARVRELSIELAQVRANMTTLLSGVSELLSLARASSAAAAAAAVMAAPQSASALGTALPVTAGPRASSALAASLRANAVGAPLDSACLGFPVPNTACFGDMSLSSSGAAFRAMCGSTKSQLSLDVDAAGQHAFGALTNVH